MNMKKYFALFLLTGGLLTTSCSDSLLDPYTPGALTGDAVITSPEELRTLMNSAYSILTDVSEISFNSRFTDEAAIGYSNGGQGLADDLTFFVNASTAAPNDIWTNHYIALAYLNRIIVLADNIEADDAAGVDALKQLKAEALTLRAYCHNQLVSYYSTNPKDVNALGVILSDQVYAPGYTGVRATNAEVYALIDSDLQDAQDLYAGLSVTVNPIFANKNFVGAMKARTYALRGDYANAGPAAQDVITNSGLTLANFSNYTSVFHTDGNAASSEVIFKFKQVNGGLRVGGVWASVNTTVTGSPFFEMGRSLFNELNTTDDSSATTLTVTAIATGGVLTIPGNSLQVNDMIVATQSRPATATMGLNGISTSPANSLVAGKVYFVKTVSGDNITLTDTANGTTTINLNAANGTGLSLDVRANAGDIRYATLVHPTSIINPNYQSVTDYRNTDKLAFRKYPGTTANGQMVNDIKIARLSEMYLIKAEAQVAGNDLAGAAATMKTLRDARFNRPQATPSYASATDAWKDILLERRKELAIEGFRFIDLKRLGALAGETIQRDSRDCELANGACSLPITDYRFALPIPEVESNPNPGILAQQNPGY